ncbi:MAG: hypothetical protein AB7F86_01800 [Bdellovibrionales bacterium]
MRKLSILLIVMSVLGCGSYHDIKSGSNPSGLGGGNVPLDFKSVKATVFDPYCIACHSQAGGNRGGVNLETYANVVADLASIRASVETGRMPRTSPMPEREKSFLLAWITAGAPEFASQPSPGTGGDTGTPGGETPGGGGGGGSGGDPQPAGPDFATVKARIFEPHCVSCHAGFAGYARVKRQIASIENMVMSNQMPMRGPLSDELKDLLSKWIQAGAPEFATGPGPGPGPNPDPIIDPNPCPPKHGDDDSSCDDDSNSDDDIVLPS